MKRVGSWQWAIGSWQWASLPIGEFDFGINKDGLCLLCFVA